jgi:twitching motility protein PilT
MADEKQPIDTHAHLEVEPEINRYFKAAIKAQASDLHLKVGQPPKLRLKDGIRNTTADLVTEEKIEKLIFEILSEKQKQFFLENGTIDFAYEVSQADRFRVNVFRQRSKISMAARRITSAIPPFESLHLPASIREIAGKSYEGLILVTGPAGCGKSMTIAAMIDYINQTRSCHIITIEDPLEFVHTDKKAIVSQREIGIDVKTYEDALNSIMKQDPDVVMIAELKDKTTLSAALRAAETGQLVFSTLHAASASQAIQRAIDIFPQEERDLARQTFAHACRAIVSQFLLPGLKKEAPMVPAVEILISNPVVQKLILEANEPEINGIIRASQSEGMQSFTESLRMLVENEQVELKTALQHAPNVDELKMALKGIRRSS